MSSTSTGHSRRPISCTRRHTSTRFLLEAKRESFSFGTPAPGQLATMLTPVQELTRSTLIHSYPHPNPTAASAVTALAQSPAVDVIGVGYADGTIRVYDIKQAEMVMQMKMDEGGVTQLSFRMGASRRRNAELPADQLDGPPILASGSTAGTFAVWDLSKGGRLIHVQRGAHEQAVSGLQFVQGQPLLVTSSGDNNIKVRTLGPIDLCLTTAMAV